MKTDPPRTDAPFTVSVFPKSLGEIITEFEAFAVPRVGEVLIVSKGDVLNEYLITEVRWHAHEEEKEFVPLWDVVLLVEPA